MDINIVKAKIEDLTASEYNPRKIEAFERAKLRESIEEFGFIDPIIANSFEGREGIIIGGHQRYALAQEMGMEEVPVIFIELEKEMEKKLNVRLNRDYGKFDMEKLAEFDYKMLKDVGFKDDELKKIDEVMQSSAVVEGEIEFTTEILEENNYVVFVFDNVMDWQVVSDRLGLKRVSALDSKEGYDRKGIGRVIKGKKLLDILDV